MPRFSVRLFGTPQLQRSSGEILQPPRHFFSIIGFLASRPKQQATKAEILRNIWPDHGEERARHCFATTLWRTKSVSGSSDGLLHCNNEVIRLGELALVDTLVFEKKMVRWQHERQEDRRYLAANAKRPIGKFLEGFDEDWIAIERERLHCLHIDTLLALAELDAGSGRWSSVIASAKAVCTLEPLREDAHRLLMTAYAKSGNRGLAARQFHICSQILSEELQVEPMEETIELARNLSSTSSSRLSTTPSIYLQSGSLKPALHECRSAFAKAIAALDNAINLL